MLTYEGDERIAEADIWFASATFNTIKAVLVRDKEGVIEARAHVHHDGVLWMHVRELDNANDETEFTELGERWARDSFATTTPSESQLPINIINALRNATRALAAIILNSNS